LAAVVKVIFTLLTLPVGEFTGAPQMTINISLLFHLKKPKNYVSGQVPIYLRITLNGQRTELATGREILPERWNQDTGRGNGTKEDVRQLNMHLDTIQAKMYEAHRLMMLDGQLITAESLKNKFTGKSERSARTLLKKIKKLLQKKTITTSPLRILSLHRHKSREYKAIFS
jgi:hypothetical protein